MTESVKKWLRQNLVVLIGLSFLAFLVYSNTLFNGFVADDIKGILENPQLGDFKIVSTNPLFFVQPLFYFLLIRIFDVNPFIFHLHSIAVHVLTVIVAYILISLFSGRKAAFFTACLFAVHPILSEPVAWISGGNYAKGSLFALASFSCYLVFSKMKKREFLVLSIFLFIFSLASSTQAVVLPLILLLYEYLFGNIQRKWLTFITFFGLSTVYVILYFSSIPARLSQLNAIYEPVNRFYNPLVQIPRAVSTYLFLIIFPKDLTLNYTAFVPTLSLIWFYAILLIFIFSLISSFKKNKQVFFFLCFFVITLLPTLLPIRIASVVAERYAYFGTVGILFAVGHIFSKLKHPGKIVFFVVIILLAGRTFIRNSDWKNQETLWAKTVRTSPLSFPAHYNLGGVYMKKEEYEKAIFEFEKTVQLAPRFAEAYFQLGVSNRKIGNIDRAIEAYKVAIKIKSDSWLAYQNLASLYFEKQNFRQAEQFTLIAIKLNPTSATLYKNLGMIYEAVGDTIKSEAAYGKANSLPK